MITRISEIIHNWMGWCPDAHTMQVKKRGDTGAGFHALGATVKSPGPSGADQSGMPWREGYEHTQRGTLIIGGVSAAIIMILITTYLFGIEWVAVIVLGIMVFVLAICSTLTASVGPDTLRIRFGPVGLIRKSWPLSGIVLVRTVTNPWYYGWGIRWTPHGPLYNVSGNQAVEVLLESGTRFRIGTDEPEALHAAIERARHGGAGSRTPGGHR